MERPGSEGFGGRRRRLVKNEVPIAPPRPLRRTSSLPAAAKPPPPLPPLPLPPEVKLAAVAVDLNVRLRSADMSPVMQERAFRFARFVLDAHSDNEPSPTQLAMRLKKEFDGLYGPAWHCIVGKSFGSFVTHSSGGFVYFSIDKLSFLLFKTEVRPIINNKMPS